MLLKFAKSRRFTFVTFLSIILRISIANRGKFLV
jgi:hypothetical protein